ncbi:MAG: hypothetical protein ABF296_10215 [Oceanococcaceae bacterium]
MENSNYRLAVIDDDGNVVAPVTAMRVIKPMDGKAGRPKATAKHIAVRLYFELQLIVNNSKRGLSLERTAEQFGYSSDREVRKIVNAENGAVRAEGLTSVIHVVGDQWGVVAFCGDEKIWRDGDHLRTTGTAWWISYEHWSEAKHGVIETAAKMEPWSDEAAAILEGGGKTPP